MTEKYSAEQIKVLGGLEGVRKRPAMYIGNTGKEGLHHLIYEVVDNSVDEALVGFCKEIKVTLNKDGSVTIEDDGRGIPVDTHPQLKIPAVEVALTKLHAGGKFDHKTYLISGGLHGVGVSVVNALSKKLIVQVKRDGDIYRQEYSRGKVKSKLEIIGKCQKNETGTKIIFFPDEQIFSAINFDSKVLETRFTELTFLNPGLKILLRDEIKNKKTDFIHEGGMIEFVKWLNKSKDILHKPVYFKKEMNHTTIEIAVQYNSGYQENIFGFVNTINTVEGGTHISGFKTALTRVINDYAKKNNIIKEGALSGEDVREGLTAIVNIKIPEPQFEGQTKTKLGNSEVKGFVDSITTSSLSEFFEENPSIAKKIATKIADAAKARLAAKKARDLVRRKNAFSLSGLPGKLADCSSRKTENTELYIVEGESAGGCFSGDTKIALVDGRDLSFRELIEEYEEGKQNFCYTIKEDGSIGIEKIENPRITKKDSDVIKITLDNGGKIICTPNHKFMLRNGDYKEAKELVKEDSIMPFHRRISKIGGRITIEGYEMVLDPIKKWVFTHLLADEYNLKKRVYKKEQGDAKHHIDFNKLNNNPEKMIECIKNYNHKIKRIEWMKEKIDVYDLEVKETHNFALASGIFVHNSAKMARDKGYQAILPLQGKILNVEKTNPIKSLSSEEIVNMITAIGTGTGEQFDLKKLRYNKIIIMTDADIDGEHIKTLLLTFFFRFMPQLIEDGHVHIALSPLYRIRKKKDHYVYSDEELKKFIEKIGAAIITRFKGLGEMSPEQLWHTTMNPKTRKMKKVFIEDAVEADRVFSMLMGSDVPSRKKFISENAKEANLDV